MTTATNDAQSRDHLVTLATPAGRGAIATVLVRGPNVIQHVQRYFQPLSGRSLDCYPIQEIVFGVWVTDEDDEGASAREDLVVSRQADDVIEIHCHGGNIASNTIIASLEKEGYRNVNWNRWLNTAAATPLERDVTSALSKSTTTYTAGVLIDQRRGTFSKVIRELQATIQRRDLTASSTILDEFAATFRCGRHLVDPWKIVLVGEPNVGKSSLINSILGYDRAIVYHQPGTTRDLVRGSTAIDGWPISFTDTAGFREAADAVESKGIANAEQQLESADLVLIVFDGSKSWSDISANWADRFAQKTDTLFVFNKSDISVDRTQFPDGVWTSALRHEGIDELFDRIRRQLFPARPSEGDAVVFTTEQHELLRATAALLENGEYDAASTRLLEYIE